MPTKDQVTITRSKSERLTGAGTLKLTNLTSTEMIALVNALAIWGGSNYTAASVYSELRAEVLRMWPELAAGLIDPSSSGLTVVDTNVMDVTPHAPTDPVVTIIPAGAETWHPDDAAWVLNPPESAVVEMTGPGIPVLEPPVETATTPAPERILVAPEDAEPGTGPLAPGFRQEFWNVNHGNDAFSGVVAAKLFLQRLGYSVGEMQADQPRGIKWGDYRIEKWRNLGPHHKAALDGELRALGPAGGDFRYGGAEIVMYDSDTLAENAKRRTLE